ncbi:hypothetical protein Hanom_Chr16g01477141 [Helianthus anomalus]
MQQTKPVPTRLGFRPLSGHQLTSWMVDWPALGDDWLRFLLQIDCIMLFLFQLYYGRPATNISNLNRFAI